MLNDTLTNRGIMVFKNKIRFAKIVLFITAVVLLHGCINLLLQRNHDNTVKFNKESPLQQNKNTLEKDKLQLNKGKIIPNILKNIFDDGENDEVDTFKSLENNEEDAEDDNEIVAAKDIDDDDGDGVVQGNKIVAANDDDDDGNNVAGDNEEVGEDGEQYDFVIVGGGVAGCVLARRLAENPSTTVLLLEAGVDDVNNTYVSVPRAASSVQKNKDIIWDYFTEPQPYLQRKKKIPFTQGRILGGSGSINGMGVTRGSPHDYDKWAEMGNTGWSYKDVLPYFKKSEKILIQDLRNSEYRGTDGLFQVRQGYQFPISKDFKAGIAELGYNFNDDYNGAEQLGFSYSQMNVDEHGYRSSTSAGYLRPVRNVWSNLKVITEALVTKIHVKNGEAKGAYYSHKSKTFYVKAKKEVIVSAGSLNTPKLLMLSGIGPREHLEEIGIPVVYDSPMVGSNLKDHVASAYLYTTSQPAQKLFTFESLLEFLLARTGPWTTTGVQLFGYFITKQQPEDEKTPDIEVMLSHHSSHIPFEVMSQVQFGNDVDEMTEMLQEIKSHEATNTKFAVGPVLLHPKMSGTVRLRSPNIEDPPIIKIDYLKHPDDIKNFIEAFRFGQKLVKTSPLEKYQPKAGQLLCSNKEFDSDEFWECFVRHHCGSLYHYTSTCKMGPNGEGVVDLDLKFNGIKKLRIVDASVMPDVPSAHTMAATIMVAEKGADLIKNTHNLNH